MYFLTLPFRDSEKNYFKYFCQNRDVHLRKSVQKRNRRRIYVQSGWSYDCVFT